jgi:hypothetical protein
MGRDVQRLNFKLCISIGSEGRARIQGGVGRDRERERGRERERERAREKERKKESEREREPKRKRERDRERERGADGKKCFKPDYAREVAVMTLQSREL